MPTDFSTSNKDFQPPRLALAELPPPNPRTIGRLRTVSNVTPPTIYMDYGTYWAAIAGGAGLPEFNLKSFGALGNGTTDDTTAIQTAVNTLAALSVVGIFGAKLVVPAGVYPHTTITMPTNTNLVIEGLGYGYPSSGSTFKYTATTGRAWDLGNALSNNLEFRGLYFLGSGGTTATNDAVYAASTTMLHFSQCSFNQFGGSAIRIAAGTGLQLFNVEAQNCLLASVPSSYSGLAARQGVLDIGCTETMMQWCNINGVAGTLDANSGRAGNGFMIAIYLRTTAGVSRCLSSVGAFAQYGWVFESSQYHQVTNCRAEYNQKDGFLIEAQQSNFTGNRAQDNSHDTDNTYSGFNVTGWANILSNNKIESVIFTNKHKYGLDVNVGAGAGNTFTNSFNNNTMFNNTRPIYNFQVSGNTTFSVSGLNYPQRITGTGTQTFDGQKGDLWYFTVNANTTSAVAVTNLIEGHSYTLIILNSSGATPAITLSATFHVSNYAAPANGKYRKVDLIYDGTNLVGVSSGDIT